MASLRATAGTWKARLKLLAVSGLSTNPRGRTAVLIVLTGLSVLVLAAMSLEASYRQYAERASTASRNTNRLLSLAIAGEIDRIDLALLAVGDEYRRQRAEGGVAAERMTAFLARLRARLPMVDGLRVVDAAGNLVYSHDDAPGGGVNVADRDYFQALRDDPRLGLVISSPLVGRVKGKWALMFARRLTEPDGAFAGMVFAPVMLDWFVRKFDSLEVGPHGVVVMRGNASRDFDLLARYPSDYFVGQTKVSDTFRAMIGVSPQSGSYEARAGADDVQRTFSYQQVGDYPLITLVGLAPQDYLREWWREAAKMAALVGAFILAAVLNGRAIMHMWRALERRSAELARSNAELEQFAYVASHDLQTPLRNVASYAQLLARRYGGRLDADADEYIGYIVEGAKRMSSMISDLLNYARISNAASPAQPVPLDEIVDVVMARLQEPIAASGARITRDPLPIIRADRTQMECLLQNLVHNALIYRDPSRVPEIHIGASPDGRGMWQLSVRDNGIGIDKDYFGKIFVIFQRLDPGRFPGGTGIGLAICHRIVTGLGGRIWVESQPGAGTTFVFTLPGETG